MRDIVLASRCSAVLCGLMCAASLSAQAPAVPSLTASQIVTEMQSRNHARRSQLRHYHSVRHYSVEYRGYAMDIAAAMAVSVDYDAASGMTFTVISENGSRLLVNKVLKRLVESEKDVQDHHSAELSPENYSFSLVGTDMVGERPAYVLAVAPRTDNKYLYRGKIWIDCSEFALMRIEAEPARNLSFWISSTTIHHDFERTDGFWLPASDRSETRVRVGGRAVLKIDYGTYDIVSAASLTVSAR